MGEVGPGGCVKNVSRWPDFGREKTHFAVPTPGADAGDAGANAADVRRQCGGAALAVRALRRVYQASFTAL